MRDDRHRPVAAGAPLIAIGFPRIPWRVFLGVFMDFPPEGAPAPGRGAPRPFSSETRNGAVVPRDPELERANEEPERPENVFQYLKTLKSVPSYLKATLPDIGSNWQLDKLEIGLRGLATVTESELQAMWDAHSATAAVEYEAAIRGETKLRWASDGRRRAEREGPSGEETRLARWCRGAERVALGGRDRLESVAVEERQRFRRSCIPHSDMLWSETRSSIDNDRGDGR